MSIFNDKALKSVAEAALKVLTQESEATHPKTDKEKKLAALAHPKDKITHKDVLVGRGVLKKEEKEKTEVEKNIENTKKTFPNVKHFTPSGHPDWKKHGIHNIPVKEETEHLNETAGVTDYNPKSQGGTRKELLAKYSKTKHPDDATAARKSGATQKELQTARGSVKEETELEEGFADMDKYMKAKAAPQPSGGAGKKSGTRYGGSKQAPDVEENDDDDKKAARGKYGARQNYKRSVKESFSEMISAYNEGGLKSLSQHLVIEEPDNEQFTKELEDQKASMEGKKKQPSVAAPSTQGVKTMPEEIELNADEINGVAIETLDEAAGKITHYVQKDKVDDHTAAMRDEGLGAKYRALPKTHPLHKTHMGITDVGDSDHGRHSEGEGISVSHYKNTMKSKMKEELTLEDFSVEELEEFMMSEEYEQLDEVSKATLASYVKKASHDVATKGAVTRQLANDSRAAREKEDYVGARKDSERADKTFAKSWHRRMNMAKAVDRLAKEEVELEERSLTPGEKKEMEKNVKGMKKKLSGFKDRYGDRAKEVMYATATKMAKKD